MTWLSQIFGFFRAFQIWITIAPWESGLRVRFGKTAKTLHPGISFRLPFLDRIFVQSIRLRTISDSGQTITTRDGKVLTVSVAVTYSITDIRKLYLTVANPESTLLCRVQAHIAQVVSIAAAASLNPKLIEDEVSKLLPADEWGLSNVRVNVTTYAFVKVYRIMNYEQRILSPVNDMEPFKTPAS